MNTLIIFHDIGTVKNTLFRDRAKAGNNLKARVLSTYGKDVDPDAFEIVQIHAEPPRFSIRHKLVQSINGVTIEPFYIYGVEYIDTCYKNHTLSNPYVRQRFDSLQEAIEFANNFTAKPVEIVKKTHDEIKPKSISPEDRQREAFGGRTIFDLTNMDFDANRKKSKAAMKSQNTDLIKDLESERIKMRREIWGVEDSANACFNSNDYSLFKASALFPILTSEMAKLFNPVKHAV